MATARNPRSPAPSRATLAGVTGRDRQLADVEWTQSAQPFFREPEQGSAAVLERPRTDSRVRKGEADRLSWSPRSSASDIRSAGGQPECYLTAYQDADLE